MKDDGETVGGDGEEGPWEDRLDRNHGSRENGPLNSPRLHQAFLVRPEIQADRPAPWLNCRGRCCSRRG